MNTHATHNSSDHHPHVMSVQMNLVIFAALMVLLVLTVVAAYTITGGWGILVAMVILVADVSFFVIGLTQKSRDQLRNLTTEERERVLEINKVKSNAISSPLP